MKTCGILVPKREKFDDKFLAQGVCNVVQPASQFHVMGNAPLEWLNSTFD
jgi:hypothetical protein